MIDEQIRDFARLAWKTAPSTCLGDRDLEHGCAWYHGIWPWLRMVDVVTAPTDHANFYAKFLGAFAREKNRERVLVSGGADQSTLAHVIGAYEGQPLQATALDRCDTPLALCRLLAEQTGRSVTTTASDILEYNPPQRYDVICTHSFLGYFSTETRPRLFAKWHQLLRPGGTLVFINRLRPWAETDRVGFAPDQVKIFVERAVAAVEKHSSAIDLSSSEMANAARLYAERKWAHPMRTREELVGYLEGAGFRVEHFEVGQVEGRSAGYPSGPTTPGGAEYAKVVAIRD